MSVGLFDERNVAYFFNEKKVIVFFLVEKMPDVSSGIFKIIY